MTHYCTLSEFYDNFLSTLYSHINETKWLRDTLSIHKKTAIIVAALNLVTDFILDPLKSNSLLKYLLMEWFSLSIHCKNEHGVISSVFLLDAFIDGKSIFASHIAKIHFI
jgi:hypothetical protein